MNKNKIIKEMKTDNNEEYMDFEDFDNLEAEYFVYKSKSTGIPNYVKVITKNREPFCIDYETFLEICKRRKVFENSRFKK